MADDFHLGMTYSFDGGMDLDLEEGDIFMDRGTVPPTRTNTCRLLLSN